jgi:hypothetical protein
VHIKHVMRTTCSTATRARDVVAIHCSSVPYSPAAFDNIDCATCSSSGCRVSRQLPDRRCLINLPHTIHPADMLLLLLLPSSSCCYSDTLLCGCPTPDAL